jgi:dTDP-4-dehydrorhamnose reductase
LAGATRLSRYEFAESLSEIFNLDPIYITPVQSKHIEWEPRRPRDSSLNAKRAEQTLTNTPLRIHDAHKKNEGRSCIQKHCYLMRSRHYS